MTFAKSAVLKFVCNLALIFSKNVPKETVLKKDTPKLAENELGSGS